jgi:hypothetical protein
MALTLTGLMLYRAYTQARQEMAGDRSQAPCSWSETSAQDRATYRRMAELLSVQGHTTACSAPAVLRAALFNLAGAVTAFSVVRHRTIERASIEVQNFVTTVELCLCAPDPGELVTERDLQRLLATGIAIIEEDDCRTAPCVSAALDQARAIAGEGQP